MENYTSQADFIKRTLNACKAESYFYGQTSLVWVEGKTDVSFFQSVFPNKKLQFKGIKEKLEANSSLYRYKGERLNNNIAVLRINEENSNCYGVIDRDYNKNNWGKYYPGLEGQVAVTDAADLETTRACADPLSLKAILEQKGYPMDDKDFLSMERSAFQATVKMELLHDIQVSLCNNENISSKTKEEIRKFTNIACRLSESDVIKNADIYASLLKKGKKPNTSMSDYRKAVENKYGYGITQETIDMVTAKFNEKQSEYMKSNGVLNDKTDVLNALNDKAEPNNQKTSFKKRVLYWQNCKGHTFLRLLLVLASKGEADDRNTLENDYAKQIEAEIDPYKKQQMIDAFKQTDLWSFFDRISKS